MLADGMRLKSVAEGVESAAVSHVEGTAVVTLSKDVDNETLTKAVVDRGYEVKEIA